LLPHASDYPPECVACSAVRDVYAAQRGAKMPPFESEIYIHQRPQLANSGDAAA